MMSPTEISILDYNYFLPAEKIAINPLGQRDASKLLLYKNGQLQETIFKNVALLLPEGCLMVFNNSRVIKARLFFTIKPGVLIEIFCLEPAEAVNEYNSVMAKTSPSRWKCLVGNASKWNKEILEKEFITAGETVVLKAALVNKISDAFIIEFKWLPAHFSFAELLEVTGEVPLPPYIKRSTNNEDTSRYQTIFAEQEGSVAAPTAGLHFTQTIFENITARKIEKTFVTLHVGAGTFKPVKSLTMQDHQMHAEYIDVTIETINTIKENTGHIVAVGTTSLRTIETLYWMGVKIILNPGIENVSLLQWDAYQPPLASSIFSAENALEALLDWMKKNKRYNIFTQTQLLIAPGYTFRMVDILITNFHQPQSTLLLLVAAAIGDDWRKTYNYALENNFRFLSYGDGNVIHIKNKFANPEK